MVKKLVIHPAIEQQRLRKVIAVTDQLAVANCETPEDASTQIGDAHAFFGKITPELLESARMLEWVQSPTASLEHYLFPELIAHPCRLTNMRGLFDDVIADHVMTYILMFARRFHIYLRRQQESCWEPVGGESARSDFISGPGVVNEIDRAHLHLSDCSVGVVGVGGIGAEVCRRAVAFGMQVKGVDPRVRRVEGVEVPVAPLDGLPALLNSSDFVVLACPHTPETSGMIGQKCMNQMKQDSFLINVGRGAVVDLDDLVQCLRDGRLAGAGLDVFEHEPLPPDHPLLTFPNVILTPHVAAASPRIAERHLAVLLDNIDRFSGGRDLRNVVDKSLWY